MKVFGIKENEAGIMEIENSLEAEQKFVGGLIEVVSITPELDLVVNDEGKLNNMKPVAAWKDGEKVLDLICGNCFVCRWNEEGEFVSIDDSDVDIIKEKLKPIIAVIENRVFIESTY